MFWFVLQFLFWAVVIIAGIGFGLWIVSLPFQFLGKIFDGYRSPPRTPEQIAKGEKASLIASRVIVYTLVLAPFAILLLQGATFLYHAHTDQPWLTDPVVTQSQQSTNSGFLTGPYDTPTSNH